jgi:hypothetical protein
MEVNNLIVEVRDRNYTRVGQIAASDLNLKVNAAHNDIGEWSLTLPEEHPLVPAISTPGAGIVITGPPSKHMVQTEDGRWVNAGTFYGRRSFLFSGPVTTVDFVESAEDVVGAVTVSGVSDNVYLWDALTFPEPTNPDATTQSKVRDRRDGTCESLLHYFVNANIGPAAPVVRRHRALSMGPNPGRGPRMCRSVRFFCLGDVLQSIAVVGDIGFRTRYSNNGLQFETWQCRDRSRELRLNIAQGFLSKNQVAITAPTATIAVVAGHYSDYSRAFHYATSPEAANAERLWGRRIERWVDQRASDDPQEYADAASELLRKEGFTGVQVRAVPGDDMLLDYGTEWELGDIVSVIVNGTEFSAQVSGWALRAGPDGVMFGITLGDTTDFDPQRARLARIRAVQNRLEYLERADDLTMRQRSEENDGGNVPVKPIPGERIEELAPDFSGGDWASYKDSRGKTLPEYAAGGGFGGGGGGGSFVVVNKRSNGSWPARPGADVVCWVGPGGPPALGTAQPGDHAVVIGGYVTNADIEAPDTPPDTGGDPGEEEPPPNPTDPDDPDPGTGGR